MKTKSVDSSVTVDLELEDLDCTVCFNSLQPPFFQCASGQVLCSSCYHKLQDKSRCRMCCITTSYNRCSRCADKIAYHETEEHDDKNRVNMSMLDLDSDCGSAGSNALLRPHGLSADCYALIIPKLSPSASISIKISGHDHVGKKEPPKNKTSTGPILKMGPCGGGGGVVRDMDMSGVNRIVKIIIRHGDAVDAMSVVYERNGLVECSEQWGGNGGNHSEVNLHEDEYLTAVHGHTGHHVFWQVIRSLTFVTNLRRLGPYGKEDGEPFVLPAAAPGGRILGFHARTGWFVDAIGTYVSQQD